MNFEERKRITDDAVSKMKWAKQPQQTAFDRMFMQVDKDLIEVLSVVNPVLKAGGAHKTEDKQALRDLVFKLFLERFDKYGKDELVALTTSIFADKVMEDVDNNPWGNNNPDILSGQ